MTPRKAGGGHSPSPTQQLDDQSSWEYSCLRFYMLLETLKAYNNLVVNEMTFVTTKSQLCSRTTSPFGSVVSSVMLELDRSGKKSKVERALDDTTFFRYRDLRDQGAWLLSEGVSILELVRLLGYAEAHHTWFCEKDMSRLTSQTYLTGFLASPIDDRSRTVVKAVKQRIHGSMESMSDMPDIEKLRLLRSGHFEFLLGFMGNLLAIDKLTQGGSKEVFRKGLAKARRDYRSSMEEISVRVVGLFKSNKIKPCYPRAVLMANGLLGRPYFLPEKDPVSLKSKGQDKLRKLYDRSLRKTARKKK